MTTLRQLSQMTLKRILIIKKLNYKIKRKIKQIHFENRENTSLLLINLIFAVHSSLIDKKILNAN